MEFFTLDFWKGIWDDFVEFLTELPAELLDSILSVIAGMIESLNPPQFMDQSLGDVLGPTLPYIGSFLAQSGFAEGFALLGAGIAFRLLRKLFTLGQW